MSEKGALAGEIKLKVKLRTLGGLGQIKVEIESDKLKANSETEVLSRYEAEKMFAEIGNRLIFLPLWGHIFPKWDVKHE